MLVYRNETQNSQFNLKKLQIFLPYIKLVRSTFLLNYQIIFIDIYSIVLTEVQYTNTRLNIKLFFHTLNARTKKVRE